VTIRVTDNGSPSLSATQQITISVNEVNNAPLLAPILSYTINEGASISITNSATDSDTPPQTLSFSLDSGAPAGMSIDPATGVITWTPSEAQGPGNYSITVRVTDDGAPPLSTTKNFSVRVNEVNTPPELLYPNNSVIDAGELLSIAVTAYDTDEPLQLMTFSIDPGAPAGVNIDPASGAFTWTPEEANVGTNLISLRVTDSGSPAFSTSGTLQVVVRPALRLTITQTENGVAIGLNALQNHTYRAEYKTDLDAPWQLLDQRQAVTSSLTFSDSSANSQRFYRVQRVD
jgi:hypothetical protein